MNEREHLVKAQAAEALADAADNHIARHTWENIAKEYRRLVAVAAVLRTSGGRSSGRSEEEPDV